METHLVSKSYLAKEPTEIARRSLEALKKQGVHYHAARATKAENQQLFLDDGTCIPETELYLSAVGRVPNIDLQLEKAGVKYEQNGIGTDRNLVTSNPAIFAIGDCTQHPQFTHLAASHGKFVIKKIVFPFAQRKNHTLPRVTCVSLTISSTGDLEKKPNSHLFSLDLSKTDKGRTHSDHSSYGVVNIDVVKGEILGASFFGAFSEDLITVYTLLIDEKIPAVSLSELITPYPTYANSFHTLSLEYISYVSQH